MSSDQLSELNIVQSLSAALLGGGSGEPCLVEVVGPWGCGKSLVAVQAAARLGRPVLVVAPGRIESENVHEDLCAFAPNAVNLVSPAWEVLPTDHMAPADDIVAERLNALEQIAASSKEGTPFHLVAPVRSVLQAAPRPEHLSANRLTLRVNTERDLESILAKLTEMGYERELMVEQRGQMSVRGGIFDIFPVSEPLPYRIEFFGDEIDSIRTFEPETQRSIRSLDEITIGPRSEKPLALDGDGSRAPATLLDHLPPGTIIVFDELQALAEEAESVERAFGDSPYGLKWHTVREAARRFPNVAVAQLPFAGEPGATRINTTTHSLTELQGRVEDFWTRLQDWDAEGYTVAVYCNNTGERQRFLELVEENGYRPGPNGFPQFVQIGSPRPGFVSPDDRLVVLSEREIFGRKHVRRTRRRFEAGESISGFGDLRAGDYVVHVVHGIGRYLGLRRFSGKSGDFLALQYAGGDTLYVPITHIDMVQKFSTGEGALPKMDRIGGATWAKTKARVKKAVKDMTEELVTLYAARQSREGHAYTPDTPWQTEFEDAFEYDETPDQLRAIAEVKRDMQSARPMDRLVCGDVGFGKTEVALRAAFKAVMDGKQVAVLAPTTVLAEQHYLTFSDRMADFPVRIAMLSRFRTAKEQKETLEKLQAGEVDIVIG
ncbi:MAG TPA: CarD family transcriptional regulator, partial [Candidatus Hydrogenedentes bacterium]|nr:CarD family transcriptional regulator [Candidatus Hydrogenedentota bacterium]